MFISMSCFTMRWHAIKSKDEYCNENTLQAISIHYGLGLPHQCCTRDDSPPAASAHAHMFKHRIAALAYCLTSLVVNMSWIGAPPYGLTFETKMRIKSMSYESKWYDGSTVKRFRKKSRHDRLKSEDRRCQDPPLLVHLDTTSACCNDAMSNATAQHHLPLDFEIQCLRPVRSFAASGACMCRVGGDIDLMRSSTMAPPTTRLRGMACKPQVFLHEQK